MSQCLAHKIKTEFDPDIISCVPRGGLSFSHLLSLELGIPCVMYGSAELFRCDTKVLVVDDSVGTGATLKEIHGSDGLPSNWKFAAFYIDEKAYLDGVHTGKLFDFYCMVTSLWVVLPWEDENKIVVGDQKSLFRNGTDPYQRD